MTKEQRNMELMQTLDDAWNAQDWDTFDKRHVSEVVVRWPAQPPTNGRHVEENLFYDVVGMMRQLGLGG